MRKKESCSFVSCFLYLEVILGQITDQYRLLDCELSKCLAALCQKIGHAEVPIPRELDRVSGRFVAEPSDLLCSLCVEGLDRFSRCCSIRAGICSPVERVHGLVILGVGQRNRASPKDYHVNMGQSCSW